MSAIKLLVTDVDGTLTDGKVYMSANGELCKAFNIKDGYGIHNILAKYNIQFAIITGRTSDIVKQRCNELGISLLFQGISDKLECLVQLINETGLTFSEVAYIGDDLNDLEVMKACSMKGCPADAVIEVKKICDFVAPHNGGDGAVRDFIDHIVNQYNN